MTDDAQRDQTAPKQRDGRVQLRRVLEQFDFLEEAVVRDVAFSDHGLTVLITLDQRPGMEPQAVTLALRGVRSAHFDNTLSPNLWDNVDALDWGADEIAGAAVEGADRLPMGHARSGDLHHVTLAWESGMRRIDIVCESVEVSGRHGNSEAGRWSGSPT